MLDRISRYIDKQMQCSLHRQISFLFRIKEIFYIYFMSKTNTAIHDNFIRAILSDKNIAIEYFRNYLPTFVSSQLDFSSITQIPDTYVSKNLQKTMSDIIYSCYLKGKKNHIKISLLIEHKSFPDKFSAVQIGSYLFSGYESRLKIRSRCL